MATTNEVMKVRRPRTLRAEGLRLQRIPIGMPGDYKPMIAQLSGGELVITAFRGGDVDQVTSDGRKCMHEDVLLFRSSDEGHTWSEPEVLQAVLPREPFISVLGDGTLLMSIHFHGRDHRNLDHKVQAYVYRSVDGGKNWLSRHLVPDEFPPGIWIHSSRNGLELSDGSVILGVSGDGGQPDMLYRSTDKGMTWTHGPIHIDDKPEDYPWPFFAETLFWQCASGKLLSLNRVSHIHWPLKGQAPPQAEDGHFNDQHERLIVLESTDYGATWQWNRDLGGYGMMYPSLLRLHDGRLLLTYTVRALDTPLGVRALVGTETDHTIDFNFDYDEIIVDDKTPDGQSSGGGFGNTIQLRDGALLTPYSYRRARNADAVGTDGIQIEVARWHLS